MYFVPKENNLIYVFDEEGMRTFERRQSTCVCTPQPVSERYDVEFRKKELCESLKKKKAIF
jgi:hypothetical protein